MSELREKVLELGNRYNPLRFIGDAVYGLYLRETATRILNPTYRASDPEGDRILWRVQAYNERTRLKKIDIKNLFKE